MKDIAAKNMIELFLIPITIVAWAITMRSFYRLSEIARVMREERISILEARKLLNFRRQLEVNSYNQQMAEEYEVDNRRKHLETCWVSKQMSEEYRNDQSI